MPLEKSIKVACMKALRARGALVYKNHGGPMGVRGIPDLVVHANGRTIYIEIKQPGEKPTEIQESEHRKLAAAGIPVCVCTSKEDAEAAFDRYLAGDPHNPGGAIVEAIRAGRYNARVGAFKMGGKGK